MRRRRLAWLVPLLRAANRRPLPVLFLALAIFTSTLTLEGCHGDIDGSAQPTERASAVTTAPANGIGKLTGVANGFASATFEYDARGRQARAHVAIGKNAYTTETLLDAMDRAVDVTTTVVAGPGAGEVENVHYDYAQGGGVFRIASSLAGLLVQSIARNARGRTEQKVLGNNVTTSYLYDNAATQRLQAIQSRAPSSQILQDLEYFWNDDSNIVRLYDAVRDLNTCGASAGDQCAYDSMHRLVQGAGGAYAHDAIGRMIVIEGRPLGYDDTQPMHAVKQSPTNTYAYDAAGNLTTRSDGRTIEWDGEERPTRVIEGGIATAEFFYDPMGVRVRKLEQDRETVYAANLEIRDGALTRFYFAGTERSAERAPDGAVSFYHSDHLKSSNLLTDAAGAVIKHTAFLPFGALRAEEGAKELHHRFTDKELDGTGLYDYGARQYDPEVGQFISADTAVSDAKDPLTLNRYAYTRGNPLLYNDPTGHFFFVVPVLVAVAFAGASFIPIRPLRMILQFGIGMYGGMGWFLTIANVAAANTPGKAGYFMGMALAFYQGYSHGWDSFEKVAEKMGVRGLRLGTHLAGALGEVAEYAAVEKALPGYGGMLYNIAHAAFNDGAHGEQDQQDQENGNYVDYVENEVAGWEKWGKDYLDAWDKSGRNSTIQMQNTVSEAYNWASEKLGSSSRLPIRPEIPMTREEQIRAANIDVGMMVLGGVVEGAGAGQTMVRQCVGCGRWTDGAGAWHEASEPKPFDWGTGKQFHQESAGCDACGPGKYGAAAWEQVKRARAAREAMGK
jgi:RHS repeat-associated protein